MLHLDYESSSLCDIGLGSYRYACDPSTRILMFAVAGQEGTPLVWDFTDPQSEESQEARSMLLDARISNETIYAHNAQFEHAVSVSRLAPDVGILVPPAINQWRCTRAMCSKAAAPESLAKAAEFFGLGNQKDPRGTALIDIFSRQDKPTTVSGFGKVPSPVLCDPIPWTGTVKVAGTPMTVREAWELFKAYCRKDVETERELHAKLGRFELTGDDLASFQFDLRMNDRGVPVNTSALRHADSLVREYRAKLEERMQALSGLSSSQTVALTEWLKARGYPGDDLRADTVETALELTAGMPPEAVEVLRLRALLSFAALKKIPTMLAAACPDGRVRGTTQWHAARTGRAGGRIIQPQNMKKSTIAGGDYDSDLCYALVREGAPLSSFEALWESPLEALASSIRHFIQPHAGKLIDADFVGVEARIAPWLCGQTDKLESLVRGEDPYKVMAAEVIYHIPYDQVTKEQRTVGKPVELQLGFGASGEGLMRSLRDMFGVVLHDDPAEFLKICNRIVKNYRERFPKYPECWKAMGAAAARVIKHGGVVWVADGKIGFTKIKTAGIEYMVMRLPSGRRLYYPHPQVRAKRVDYTEEEMLADPWKREKGGYWIDDIVFCGKLRDSAQWGNVHTWTSRLFENAVQAIGVDLLNHGCIEAEKAGYEIFMIVHDQALAHDNLPLDGFVEKLCSKQPWAESFPLEADGAIHPYYLK